MDTLNGIVEKVELAMGLLDAATKYFPGNSPYVVMLRALVEQAKTVLNTNGIRVAMAEVESQMSAEAQAIADAWPEPAKP